MDARPVVRLSGAIRRVRTGGGARRRSPKEGAYLMRHQSSVGTCLVAPTWLVWLLASLRLRLRAILSRASCGMHVATTARTPEAVVNRTTSRPCELRTTSPWKPAMSNVSVIAAPACPLQSARQLQAARDRQILTYRADGFSFAGSSITSASATSQTSVRMASRYLASVRVLVRTMIPVTCAD